jgi:hypothetical protein
MWRNFHRLRTHACLGAAQALLRIAPEAPKKVAVVGLSPVGLQQLPGP